MFSETIQARTRGHRVQLAVLAELQFVERTMFVHNGGGTLASKDGQEWYGLCGAARVSGLGASALGQNRKVTIGLDAEDSKIKLLFAEQSRQVKGRKFRFWGQFYDDDLQPLDPRFHIHTGIGDVLSMQKTGTSSRSIDLSLEDFFVRRRRSAVATVTHADQQLRDPGSTGFIYVNQMVDKTLNLYDARD